jgi:predicted kinase
VTSRSRQPLLIVVNGPPAAGKTTLAEHLERALRLPHFSKDRFKERLYEIEESERWHALLAEREFSARLGANSIAMMLEAAESVLASGGSVIVEANLRPELAGPELAAIEERTGCRLLQVLVTAETTTLLERYVERQRSEERHFGHLLPGFDESALADSLPWPTLDIDDTIEVDTTDLERLDYAPLLRQVRARLSV